MPRTSIDDYWDLWADPNRYILVVDDLVAEGLAGAATIMTAETLIPFTMDVPAEIYQGVIQRMRDAGGRQMTLSTYREHRREDWKSEGPQNLIADPSTTGHLVRLSKGPFHLVFRGPLRPIMTGHELILITRAIADVLESAWGGEFETRDAVIFDPETQTLINSHCELVLKSELTPEKLREFQYEGDLWHHRRSHLFASIPVCEALLKAQISGISFHRGFSQFAGEA